VGLKKKGGCSSFPEPTNFSARNLHEDFVTAWQEFWNSKGQFFSALSVVNIGTVLGIHLGVLSIMFIEKGMTNWHHACSWKLEDRSQVLVELITRENVDAHAGSKPSPTRSSWERNVSWPCSHIACHMNRQSRLPTILLLLPDLYAQEQADSRRKAHWSTSKTEKNRKKPRGGCVKTCCQSPILKALPSAAYLTKPLCCWLNLLVSRLWRGFHPVHTAGWRRLWIKSFWESKFVIVCITTLEVQLVA